MTCENMWLKRCLSESNIPCHIDIMSFFIKVAQKMFDPVDSGIMRCRSFLIAFFYPFLGEFFGKNRFRQNMLIAKMFEMSQMCIEVLFRVPG